MLVAPVGVDHRDCCSGPCRRVLSHPFPTDPAVLKKNYSDGKDSELLRHSVWGCAKGAAKASCGEMVVQKGVLESPFLLCPAKVFKCFKGKP